LRGAETYHIFTASVVIKKKDILLKTKQKKTQKRNQEVCFLQDDLTGILTKEISESIHKNVIVHKVTSPCSK
jgi:hypothetical protein